MGGQQRAGVAGPAEGRVDDDAVVVAVEQREDLGEHHRLVAELLAHPQPPDRQGHVARPVEGMEIGGEGCRLTIRLSDRGVAGEPGAGAGAMRRPSVAARAAGGAFTADTVGDHPAGGAAEAVGAATVPSAVSSSLPAHAAGAQSSTRLIIPMTRTSCSSSA